MINEEMKDSAFRMKEKLVQKYGERVAMMAGLLVAGQMLVTVLKRSESPLAEQADKYVNGMDLMLFGLLMEGGANPAMIAACTEELMSKATEIATSQTRAEELTASALAQAQHPSAP